MQKEFLGKLKMKILLKMKIHVRLSFFERMLFTQVAFVMSFAELFNSFTRFSDEVFWHGQHDAEERRIEETWKAGKRLNALLSCQVLSELQTRRKLWEFLKVNANHHVHCACNN